MNKDTKNQGILLLIGALIFVGLCTLMYAFPADKNNSETIATGENVIQINEDIAFDEYDVTLVITQIKGSNLEFYVQNNSSEDYIYYIDAVDVNACRVYYSGTYTKPVTAGNKALDSFNISGASEYGIKKVNTIDITASVFNGDNSCKESKHILIDAEETFSPDILIKEKVYEDDNLELFVVKTGTSLDKYDYLAHNKTGEEMSVQISNVAVNGIMSEHFSMYFNMIQKGYCYTGADAKTSIMVWSALGDEIKEKGFDIVESIYANIQVWIGQQGDDKEYYEVKNVNINSMQ